MLKHVILAAVIALMLFNSGIFVFAAPVPIFYIYCVYHRRQGLLASLMALAVTTGLAIFKVTGFQEVFYLSYFLLIAVILGEGVARKVRLFKLSATSMLAPWAGLMAGSLICQFVLGVDIVGALRSYFVTTLDQALSVQAGFASLSAPQVALLKENGPAIADLMIKTMPALTLLFTMMVVSVTLLLGRSLTKKFGVLKYFGNVAVMHFPFWPVWLLIVCGALYFANAYTLASELIKFIAIDGLIFCAGMFFIQGCFVLSFWLNKGRSPFLRLMVYGVIIMFLQVVGFIIIALGLSDQWFDFRRKNLKQTAA